MTIAHFGTFDVDNYGDLLFPHIAEWRLPNESIVHLSPAGGGTVFRDALPAIGIAAFERRPKAVIVGGGNIVHLRGNTLREYRQSSRLAYPQLSVGAAALAEKFSVPLMFNGPSIPITHLNWIERRFLGRTVRNASYLAFRDSVSASVARRLGGRDPCLVPDTAFDISRMWPVDRAERPRGRQPYISVHVNSRYGGDAASTAQALDRYVEQTGVAVRFLPIGPCHGDVDYMRAVAASMKHPATCVTEMSLRGFASEIAHAEKYVGSSMHGFITALSYGVPALLVLGEKPMHKFAGVLDAAGLSDAAMLRSWSALPDCDHLASIMSETARRQVTASLDRHWQAISATCRAASATRRQESLRGWQAAVAASISVKAIRKAVRAI